MILQFKVKNFLSIREEQMLDFTASPDKTYEEYAVVKIKNVRISKIGIIYGPNASGKSNILKALAWLVFYVILNKSRKSSLGTGLTPFLMDAESRNQPSSFTLIFYIGDIRYEYFIEMDSRRIYKEELYYYPKNRRALFFERNWVKEKGNSVIEFGTLLNLTSLQKLFIESNCIANSSVLSTYKNSNVEKNDAFDTVYSYLEETILPMLDNHMDLGKFANDVVRLDSDSKTFICDMMGKADFNISDLYIKEENGEVTDEALEQFKQIARILHLPEPQGKYISREELFFTHKTPFYTGDLPNVAESDGTNRMYGLSALLFMLVRSNQILVCDELDNSLHYDLFFHIVKTFLVNSERGQLIFSTHNLMLLDEEFVRRDMVYFANKNISGATEIYRAKDFGLHKEVSILNAYRAGKLGAKPQLGSIFIDS